MLTSLPPATGGGSTGRHPPGAIAKNTWMDVVAQGQTVLFASFLVIRGISLDQAVLTAVATVAGIKILINPPHAVGQSLRLMREIARQLRSDR
ncbi:MAG TPA: hypothetical protein VFX16_19170 [Pseudonocardiaceae bacterium]|nr:hypothetical protein [Pseudonocardiaceae bacterium]